jgi:hypothetical protein
LKGRGEVVTVAHLASGEFALPGNPVQLSDAPTADVYREWLARSANAVACSQAGGVIESLL